MMRKIVFLVTGIFLIAASVPLPTASSEETLNPSPAQLKIPTDGGYLIVNRGSLSPVRYGVASWYSESDPGINLHTANGEIFDDSKLTCASWDYSFGTRLKITNLANGTSVICRVNDRGPNKRLNRLVDLTKTAFNRIADTDQGLIKVSVKPLKK